jgi:hypothetical protein
MKLTMKIRSAFLELCADTRKEPEMAEVIGASLQPFVANAPKPH